MLPASLSDSFLDSWGIDSQVIYMGNNSFRIDSELVLFKLLRSQWWVLLDAWFPWGCTHSNLSGCNVLAPMTADGFQMSSMVSCMHQWNINTCTQWLLGLCTLQSQRIWGVRGLPNLPLRFQIQIWNRKGGFGSRPDPPRSPLTISDSNLKS